MPFMVAPASSVRMWYGSFNNEVSPVEVGHHMMQVRLTYVDLSGEEIEITRHYDYTDSDVEVRKRQLAKLVTDAHGQMVAAWNANT